MTPCPNCKAKHDTSTCITGDWILCLDCDCWLEVKHLAGGTTTLTAKEEPRKIPAKKRGRRK